MNISNASASRSGFTPSYVRGAAAAPQMATSERPPLPPKVQLSERRDLGTRDWWAFHVGSLRSARNLAAPQLAQQIIAALDAGKNELAGRLLRLFFTKITSQVGLPCLQVARRCLAAQAPDDALQLFRAARMGNCINATKDALALAYLLIRNGDTTEAIGVLTPFKRQEPKNAQVPALLGAAWLLGGLAQGADDAPGFAAARTQALRALQLASHLDPLNETFADNLRLAHAVYPGPTYGNPGRSFPAYEPTNALQLRPVVLAELQRQARYTVRSILAVGAAARYQYQHFERPENFAAIEQLRGD